MQEKLYKLGLLLLFCCGVFFFANSFANTAAPPPPPPGAPPGQVAISATKNQLTQIQALFHRADYMDLAQPVNEFSSLMINQ